MSDDAAELRQAIDRADGETALRLAAAAWRDLMGQGSGELLARTVELTRDAPASEPLAQVRYAAGLVAFRAGDNERCRELSRSALATADAVGSDAERARAHVGLSRADFRTGAYDDAWHHADAADEAARRAGADDLAVAALHMKAEITRARRDYAAAIPLYEQLLAIDEAAGDARSLAMEHYNLGSVLLQHADIARSREHVRQAAELLGDKPDNAVYVVLAGAGLAARTGDVDRAGRLMGFVHAELERTGEVLDPAEQLEHDSHVDAATAADDDGYRTAYVAGRDLTSDQAVQLVREVVA